MHLEALGIGTVLGAGYYFVARKKIVPLVQKWNPEISPKQTRILILLGTLVVFLISVLVAHALLPPHPD